MAKPDIIVIGAGIVGLSAAAELSSVANVTVLEMESQPAYHSSGRSAAACIEPYMNETVARLTQASLAFFRAPLAGFAEAPLVRQRGGLTLANDEQSAEVDAFLAEWRALVPQLEEISVAAALKKIPVLRREFVVRALFDPSVGDLDVHALISGHRKRVMAAGGSVRTSARVDALEHGVVWRVRVTAAHTSGVQREWLAADVVINAAGAWGEEIGKLAGVRGVGLVPMRRTACLIDAPPGHDVRQWPMAHDVRGTFYFRPDGNRLMVSPADATPTQPCDAQPEEIDVAIGIDRAQAFADLPVRAIAHRWAGLRSFVADNIPVAGYASGAPGFFWLVGQGGFGVQTSPAMARIARALVLGEALPSELLANGITSAAFAAGRKGLAG